MKIPTLLGIALIVTLTALGALYYYYNPAPKENINFQVSNLQVVNITDTQATIIWQTSQPKVGEVEYSSFQMNLKKASDNRDHNQSKARMVHFVSLNNLKPDTKYSYKIKNDEALFPDKALEFKTAKVETGSNDDLTFSFVKPIRGTVLNTNLNPIDESLVLVKIEGAQELATFSSTAGNFIMPLKTVLNKSLDKIFTIPNETRAQLIIVKGDLKSEVKIMISEDSLNLPPISIGTNLDLTNYKLKSITKITFSTIPSFGNDFNGDAKVNSLDLALLREAAKSGTVNTQSNFDINKDGIVDQEDVDQFSKSLAGN